MHVNTDARKTTDTAARDSLMGQKQVTLAIACSPLDAGQTDVMIDRQDKQRLPLGKKN